MLDVAEVDFTLDIEPIGELALRTEAERLFDAWDRRLPDLLPLDDYAVRFGLEEGSLKGKGRVRATLVALFLAIDQFDGITGGIEKMARAGRSAASYLVQEARSLAPTDRGATLRSRRSAGDVGQLERLFIRVRNRELTAEDAALDAKRLLEQEPGVSPELLARVEEALFATPKQPKQLDLELDDRRIDIEELGSTGTHRPKRRPPPEPDEVPVPELFRVEIWRESKKGKRHVVVGHL